MGYNSTFKGLNYTLHSIVKYSFEILNIYFCRWTQSSLNLPHFIDKISLPSEMLSYDLHCKQSFIIPENAQ